MFDMKMNEAMFKKIQNDMFSYFTSDGFEPIEASVDGLVSVTVDASFQVQSVSIHGLNFDSHDARKLEEAMITAFNNAVREVANRNGEHFTQVLQKADS